jgi:sporulation protein YlmC with PRC-barrel domain
MNRTTTSTNSKYNKYTKLAFSMQKLRKGLLNSFVINAHGGYYMSTKLSKLYEMEIFTDSGLFVGKAEDFILDLETGNVARVLLVPLPGGKDAAKEALRQKSIKYENVRSVGDVIVVAKTTTPGQPGM